MTPSAESADPAVSRFLDAVWMERGLSPNTLAAYRADLTALARWLAGRSVPIMRTSRADLQDFIDRKSTRLNQSPCNLVCRLLLEKKKTTRTHTTAITTAHP